MAFLFRMRGSAEAHDRMNNDPDIQQESLPTGHPPVKAKSGAVCPVSKLSIVHQSHRATTVTAKIFADVGGLPAVRKFTTNFYQKAFADPHLDQFIRSHDDPHGERFALWIAEKFGAGTPWTEERRTRDLELFVAKGHQFQTAHDRSSAHFAAWHSPKRTDHAWGQHFNLNDCRVWMRLHFWAAREEGVLEHAPFADYYVRFIAHFVSVYARQAPSFARESMRWSADKANIQRYLDNGRRMPEIMNLSYQEALEMLPAEERAYTGSVKGTDWPYEQ